MYFMTANMNLARLRVSAAQLETIRGHVQAGRFDEYYPHASERLFSSRPEVEIDYEKKQLVLPRDGPWNVTNHPNRTNAPVHLKHSLAPEIPNTDQLTLPTAETIYHAQAGYWLDQHKLPVTEAAVQMLEDPTIGVATGLGPYWRRGVNLTSDLLVTRRLSPAHPWQALLIWRLKEKQAAFPGGFADPTDRNGAHTARRETGEEAGLTEIRGRDRRLHAGLLIDAGATAHAMTGNEIYFVEGAENDYLFDAPLTPDPNETTGAGWYTLEQIDDLQNEGRFSSHHQGHLLLLAAE